MKKIFIIEDDEAFIRMLERMFASETVVVESALDGADGLAKLYLMDDAPAVILLDIMIPVLSGVSVLRLLKKSDKLKNVPVVILSNLTPSQETEDKIVNIGAALYLHKSEYTPQQIVKKVNEIIDASPPASTANV